MTLLEALVWSSNGTIRPIAFDCSCRGRVCNPLRHDAQRLFTVCLIPRYLVEDAGKEQNHACSKAFSRGGARPDCRQDRRLHGQSEPYSRSSTTGLTKP